MFTSMMLVGFALQLVCEVAYFFHLQVICLYLILEIFYKYLLIFLFRIITSPLLLLVNFLIYFYTGCVVSVVSCSSLALYW